LSSGRFIKGVAIGFIVVTGKNYYNLQFRGDLQRTHKACESNRVLLAADRHADPSHSTQGGISTGVILGCCVEAIPVATVAIPYAAYKISKELFSALGGVTRGIRRTKRVKTVASKDVLWD
jgi:hypothetical protein